MTAIAQTPAATASKRHQLQVDKSPVLDSIIEQLRDVPSDWLFKPMDTAQRIGMSVSWLEVNRAKNDQDTIPWTKIGTRIRYRCDDIRRWAIARRYGHAAQQSSDLFDVEPIKAQVRAEIERARMVVDQFSKQVAALTDLLAQIDGTSVQPKEPMVGS